MDDMKQHYAKNIIGLIMEIDRGRGDMSNLDEDKYLALIRNAYNLSMLNLKPPQTNERIE